MQDHIKASINLEKRNLIRNNHSSTHLLHASLKKILGSHVSQKGSLVNDKKLRFDFSHHDVISEKNLNKIELLVNKIINQNDTIQTEIQDYQTALNNGAIALFGEKYGDEVRVITMGKDEDNIFSRELCGGTHVKNTGDIKKFKITSQSSVASGIRRLEAVTNIGVDHYKSDLLIKENEKNIQIENEINKYLNLIKKAAPKKIVNISKEIELNNQLKDIKNIYNAIKKNADISENIKNIKVEKVGNYNLIYLLAKKYPSNEFKLFIDEQKKSYPNDSVIILVSCDDTKVSIIVGITEDLTNKFDATNFVKLASTIVGGKGGGGRKDLAQAGGNKPENADKIYTEIKNEILKLV